ncbi:unnamed protein product [Ectocarpus sp. CCAP 1310/34]|nr:unnamed protein product [Ectocarpus sp. CCAP 1310/34]
MGLFEVLFVCLLAVIAPAQELQECTLDTGSLTVGSSEDVADLIGFLNCSNGDFSVEWVGDVFVTETIRITSGTSLNITGDGPGAIADGQNITQLFYVDGGSKLRLSDMTLAHGNASEGGAIYVTQSIVSFSGNIVFSSNYADTSGGAIYATSSSTVSWDGDGISFNSNSAASYGGAIYVSFSTVSWDNDGTGFSSNSAPLGGGAIHSLFSNVSWEGDGTQFKSNYGYEGGAIYAHLSNVSWDGDGTQFTNNPAESYGGAIYAYLSNVSWDGDDTQFMNNSATTFWGGAIYAGSSNVSWDGDRTQFSFNNAAGDGGAIYSYDSTVSWDGAGTVFNYNNATGDGGAIYSDHGSKLSWDGSPTFSSNVAVGNGGALAFIEFENEATEFTNATFINNTAGVGAGAWYFESCANALSFSSISFQSNSAGLAGGAIAAYVTGTELYPATFSGCKFFDNKASGGTGGAVETLSGRQEFISCDFEGNSAYVGGAMRLGGTVDVRNCSFLSNSATSRGLAIAVVAFANISGASFDRNELYCEAGLYREDTEGEPSARFETVCLDCPECDDCHVTRSSVTPACELPLEHTTAVEPGLTLETLDIHGGYWRATSESDKILACYNTDACTGGQTGADSFCASGYMGPCEEGEDCSVCETGFAPSLAHTCTRCSSSRRQGLLAVAVIAALVAVFAIVTIFKYLLSTEVDEGNAGCFHRRILRAVPVQTLKIIVVVWQILTQFADVANITYPQAYQDFLSAIDVVNFDLGSALAAGCLWPDIDFHDRLLLGTLGPLVAVGFLVMTYRVAVRRNGTAGGQTPADNTRHKHLSALLLLTFLIYSSVSSTVFQTFACETLDDGIEYLRVDYTIHCTDAKHKAFEVYAGIMVVVYPVGIPLLYAILLFQRRDVLGDARADKTVAQPIAGLWEPYRPERFYYEVIECGRRIMLTGVVAFIFPNDAAQIAITMLVAFFFSLVFEVMSPYTSESDTWLSRGGHVIVFLSMFDALLLKVDVSSESEQSQDVFAGVFVAGHVLLILAIVVEVVGICLASGKKRGVEEAVPSEGLPVLRPRGGSDDVPVFESAPASWKTFVGQASVSEKPGPRRSASGAVVTMGESS